MVMPYVQPPPKWIRPYLPELSHPRSPGLSSETLPHSPHSNLTPTPSPSHSFRKRERQRQQFESRKSTPSPRRSTPLSVSRDDLYFHRRRSADAGDNRHGERDVERSRSESRHDRDVSNRDREQLKIITDRIDDYRPDTGYSCEKSRARSKRSYTYKGEADREKRYTDEFRRRYHDGTLTEGKGAQDAADRRSSDRPGRTQRSEYDLESGSLAFTRNDHSPRKRRSSDKFVTTINKRTRYDGVSPTHANQKMRTHESTKEVQPSKEKHVQSAKHYKSNRPLAIPKSKSTNQTFKLNPSASALSDKPVPEINKQYTDMNEFLAWRNKLLTHGDDISTLAMQLTQHLICNLSEESFTNLMESMIHTPVYWDPDHLNDIVWVQGKPENRGEASANLNELPNKIKSLVVGNKNLRSNDYDHRFRNFQQRTVLEVESLLREGDVIFNAQYPKVLRAERLRRHQEAQEDLNNTDSELPRRQRCYEKERYFKMIDDVSDGVRSVAGNTVLNN